MSNPGASAPSNYTVNYDSLLSTTFNAYRGQMVDNIFASNAFLAALRKMDGVIYQDGGERIQQPLMYEKNDTVNSYKGAETLTVTFQDGMTSAFYEWCELAATIAITRREERQNSGEARLLNLLEQKIKQAEYSIEEAVNKQLLSGTVSGTTFVPGNSGKDLNPLAWFFRKLNATDPTVGGNVGNIAGATYSWWRHKTGVADNATKDTGNSIAKSVTSFKGLEGALKSMYNTCGLGTGGSPNLVVLNQGTYEIYEQAMQERQRYTDLSLADQGFDNIKLKGATCIYDEKVPNLDEGLAYDSATYDTNNKQGTAFFLNTKFYKLCIDKQTDFVTTPFVEPENQTVKTAKILFMGNTICTNMRKNGVLYAISNTIAS